MEVETGRALLQLFLCDEVVMPFSFAAVWYFRCVLFDNKVYEEISPGRAFLYLSIYLCAIAQEFQVV
eukprot:scaffold66664_cov53-Phaeocystis_antarctica.AAC.1